MTIKRQKINLVALDPEARSSPAERFEQKLRARIIGQEAAVVGIASVFQVLQAGMMSPGWPLGTLLFLGPTGSGKTRVVEAVAEVLFGDPHAMIKIDCAEFQHSHEISKLVGSPPGYIGHRETGALLTQENLDRFHTAEHPLTLLLFDEIEKASDALWQLLLGILDKATLTLGDNRRVDFSRCLIVLTSNLGAREMGELVSRSLGFAPARAAGLSAEHLEQQLNRTAMEAARRRFSPEFMNRLDKVVVFRSLLQPQLEEILQLELNAVQQRIDQSAGAHFTFRLTEAARAVLLTEGFDHRYGARHLKRAIERLLVFPLAGLMASGQVQTGAVVLVQPVAGALCFCA
ncbi:MAG TPA: AAA family ATPase [Blastocatellia bacterium]|nr:AAA family ATPase [Blastocatellia bacterium]